MRRSISHRKGLSPEEIVRKCGKSGIIIRRRLKQSKNRERAGDLRSKKVKILNTRVEYKNGAEVLW